MFFSRYQAILIGSFFLLFNFLIRWGAYTPYFNDRLSNRQGDTYAMSLLLADRVTDIFHPKYFQAQEHGNIDHYYLAEFPLYQFIVALIFRVFGEQVLWTRLVTLVASTGVSLGVYSLGRKIANQRVGLLAGLIAPLFPTLYFWGRAVTPDVLGLAAFTGSLALLLNRNRSNKGLVFSSLLFALSVLTKPYYFAFGLVHVAVFYRSSLAWRRKLFRLAAYYALPVVLFAAWRGWILSFPLEARSDPDFVELMHGGQGLWNYHTANGWLSYFTQFYFFGELLTPMGGILSLVGLTMTFVKKRLTRNREILVSWFFVSLAVTIVVAKGSQVHDYYLLHWIPVCALLTALAVDRLAGSAWHALKRWYGLLLQRRHESFLFGAGISAFVLSLGLFSFAFLVYQPFFIYKAFLFKNETLHSDSLLIDYDKIAAIIPQSSSVVVILPSDATYPLNMIRRFGFLFHLPYEGPCKTREDLLDNLGYFDSVGVEYLLLYTEEIAGSVCPRATYNAYLESANYTREYVGKGFTLFRYRELGPSE